ncbi:TPA: hypothetical protein DCX16_01180 [bacterium]|nr:hypothetical protein [bacterium]
MLAWIILFGVLFPVLFIFISWIVTKSGKLENKTFRIPLILTGIIFLGGMVVVLPFVPQPRLVNLYLRFAVGIPLAVFGIAFRIYPLIYFRRMKTRSDLVRPSKLVINGPYSIVRHPQYVGGIIFIIGWFLIWGGLYSFYILPVLIIMILLQAFIEEKYILEKEFGNEYREYKKKVGMFLPKVRRKG